LKRTSGEDKEHSLPYIVNRGMIAPHERLVDALVAFTKDHMLFVLFIPDFVLADKPEVLRACPARISADLCRRIGMAVERCHGVTEASQRFHICADEDPTRVGVEASPEAMAVGFVRAQNAREVRLEVRRASGGDPVDTVVFTVGTYEGAIAANELREAFLHFKDLPKTTDYKNIRYQGFRGVLINLRLTPVRKLGRLPGTLHKNESDQVGFAVGLPLYDAAGHVIDLRRYSLLSGIGRDGLKPAAELLKQLAL
jgi:hypothetical protein